MYLSMHAYNAMFILLLISLTMEWKEWIEIVVMYEKSRRKVIGEDRKLKPTFR